MKTEIELFNGRVSRLVSEKKTPTAGTASSAHTAARVPAHYEYAPFGVITRTSKNTPFSLDFISLNPWRFSSEFYDPELDLVYFNFRHYSPDFGRWLSRDPIEEQGGVNLYEFCENGVFSNYDFLRRDTTCGTCPLEECLRKAAEIHAQCLADAQKNYETQDRLIEENYNKLSQSAAALENACKNLCRILFGESNFFKRTCDRGCSGFAGVSEKANYGIYTAAKANNELSLWGNKRQCENDHHWRRAACHLTN